MKENLFYYSVGTFIAFKIAEKYYGDNHYLWCTKEFNSSNNPPSSNPIEILKTLKLDVSKYDFHSAKIKENKAGIRRGAQYKLKAGVITQLQFNEIISTIKYAQIDSFRPILFIIHAESVRTIAKNVEVKWKANVFSEEILLEKVNRTVFDIIELP